MRRHAGQHHGGSEARGGWFARSWPSIVVGWVWLWGAPAVGRSGGLEWIDGDGYRRARLEVPSEGKPGFSLLAPARTGLQFTNRIAQSRYVTNQIYLNGSGVAAGDVDGDGWCDLFFCGLDNANVLFRNLGGWEFAEVTAGAGVGMEGKACTGAALADLDGDRDLDLIVNTVGEGTFVFFNDGRGRFAPLSPGTLLNYLRAGMSLALADVDGDGDVDLYVANYRTSTLRDMPNTRLRITEGDGRFSVVAVNDRPTTDADLVGRFEATREGRIVEHGEPDVLFLNDGKGGFSAVSFTGGAFLDEDGRPLRAPPYDWGLTAAFRDLNADGAPDLYVCNDFESPDRIWINQGGGRFRALPRLALRQTSIFSMSVDFADVDRDGHDDFFVSDMLSRSHGLRMLETGEVQPTHLPLGAIDNRPQYSHNALLRNRGDGTFAEVSQFAGVEASEWTWSPNFLDVDLDGYEDLVITTGHELQMMNGDIIERAEVLKTQRQMSSSELQRLRTMFPRNEVSNVIFRNRGDFTFEDVTQAWGFGHPDVGNGVAQADLDNDGDLDLAINNLNGPAELYRNEGVAPRVAVRLAGQPPNTEGIGARLEFRGGAVRYQSQEMPGAGRYLSSGQTLRVFAAGPSTNSTTLQVTWRSGRRSLLSDIKANHLYEVREPDGLREATPPTEAPPAWFADVSERLDHRHHEEPFDDFARQPLLPNRLSQLGPGVGWCDFNGDGLEDVVVSSGKGGIPGIRLNEGDGTFRALTDPPFHRPAGRDQTAVLAAPGLLIVGSSNYEDGSTNGGCIRLYDAQAKTSGESVLGQGVSVGPLGLADIDGDGDLDLFVGGRVIPARYPEPATSLLLRREGGRLVVAQRLERLGLVSGAVFTDLTGDGRLELVLACEWGPIRMLRSDGASFQPWDPLVELRRRSGSTVGPLSGLTGWWAGVASGDLDGDGRADLIVSNWGLNSRYRPTPEFPVRIHYAELGGAAGLDVIESYVDRGSGREWPWRGWRPIRAALPFLQEKVDSYATYGRLSLQELYGERLIAAGKVEANTLESLVLLNRGDRFEASPLPDEAQWAPAYGVVVADYDGDGAEDVFLSQNFFGVNPDAWRLAAGRGLWLRGDGRGRLEPVPGPVSGVLVYGEQRGCAVGDYDADGRPDLVVSQNANATKLYRNVRAVPGLRVRLRGPTENPAGVGALMRVRRGEIWGPAREIQAGSGYWSQNSPVQILATPQPASTLRVRWPGGKTVDYEVPAGAREVSADPSGRITVQR